MNAPTDTSHPTGPKPTAEELSRRRFFLRLSLLVGGSTVLGLAAPLVGFVVAPLTRRPPEVWRTVGKVTEFPIGQTRDVRFEDASPLPWAGVTARTAAWLRRENQDSFVAFSINCSHLGCPVRWLEQAQLFMCPCHGGVYYRNGDVAAGPPERPLTQYPVRIVNGEVQLQTGPLPLFSKKK